MNGQQRKILFALANCNKSIIKLDKNFENHIHGNHNLIEQGRDVKGKFYKIYYQEEN
jgi:hypothetical protein